MATITVQPGRIQPGGPSVQPGGSIATASPAQPVGGPVLPGIAFQFAGAIVATSLSITVQNLTTSTFIPGTVSYNSSSHLATWTAASGSPLVKGVRYLVTVSGATATDGTPMVPESFPFTLNSALTNRWFPGLARRHFVA